MMIVCIVNVTISSGHNDNVNYYLSAIEAEIIFLSTLQNFTISVKMFI